MLFLRQREVHSWPAVQIRPRWNWALWPIWEYDAHQSHQLPMQFYSRNLVYPVLKDSTWWPKMCVRQGRVLVFTPAGAVDGGSAAGATCSCSVVVRWYWKWCCGNAANNNNNNNSDHDNDHDRQRYQQPHHQKPATRETLAAPRAPGGESSQWDKPEIRPRVDSQPKHSHYRQKHKTFNQQHQAPLH